MSCLENFFFYKKKNLRRKILKKIFWRGEKKNDFFFMLNFRSTPEEAFEVENLRGANLQKKGVYPRVFFFAKKMQKKCIFREKKAFFCDFSPNFCQKWSKNRDFSPFFFFRRGAMLTKKHVSRSIVRVAKTRQFIQY